MYVFRQVINKMRAVICSKVSILGFTDIHCHIIPSVDDGAQNMEQAQEMIRLAYAGDTRRIIATPHYGTSRAKASAGVIVTRFRELLRWTKDNYPEMELFLGQELSYHHGLDEQLKRGAAFSMAGSHYALVEFQPDDDYSRIRQGLQAVQMAGYWPILAHVERCQRLASNVDYIKELVHMGIYIQINAKSVTGENGWQCKSCTKKLLKRELVHFVASDGHDTKKRIPSIQKAVFRISSRYGKKYALQLSVVNPGKVIADEFI